MDFIKDFNIDKIRNMAEDAINQAVPKTDVEKRVFEVLSHKNWGASTTLLNEIARDTYDYEKYGVVTKLIWEAMDGSRPAAWRVVFKSLTLLEHLMKNGSDRIIEDSRNHLYQLRSLQNFNYYEGTTDRGIGVREKAKELIEILGDNDRVREEREKARALREKFGGSLGGVGANGNSAGGSRYGGYGGGGEGKSVFSSSSGSNGYGMGGIDSDPRGYSGRYANESNSSAFSSSRNNKPDDSSPITEPKTSEVKKKKKKKKEKTKTTSEAPPPSPAPSSTEIDLFSFDTPAPTQAAPMPASNVQSFDAFGTSNSISAPVPTVASLPSQQQQPAFDAFSQSSSQPGSSVMISGAPNNVTVGRGMAQQQQPQLDVNIQYQQSTGSDAFGDFSGANSAPSINTNEDDDFGDFSGANKEVKVQVNDDPLGKLVSLDSLSLSSKPKVSAASLPVPAPAGVPQNSAPSSGGFTTVDSSFMGLDGLGQKNLMNKSLQYNASNKKPGQPVMMTPAQSKIDSVYGNMNPVQPQQQQQQPSNSNIGMQANQMSMQQQQMMMQMMNNPQMMQQMQMMMMSSPQMMEQMMSQRNQNNVNSGQQMNLNNNQESSDNQNNFIGGGIMGGQGNSNGMLGGQFMGNGGFR